MPYGLQAAAESVAQIAYDIVGVPIQHCVDSLARCSDFAFAVLWRHVTPTIRP